MTTKFINLSIFAILHCFLQFQLSAQDEKRMITAQLAPQATEVELFARWELGIKLPESIDKEVSQFLKGKGNGLNPYDPDQVDLQLKLHSPNGKDIIRFAFYFQAFKPVLQLNQQDPDKNKNEYSSVPTEFAWRCRFAPDQIGEWSYSLELRINGEMRMSQDGGTFNCISGQHKGRLVVQPGERYLRYSNSDQPFFAVGENLSSGGPCSYRPSENLRHMTALQELIDAGGNFTRFELGAQSALPDWPLTANYQEKQDEMFAFDHLVELCEQNNVYFILFRHHVEAWEGAEWMNYRWGNNPYFKDFKGSIMDYFTDDRMMKTQQSTLRYIYSRWGYSPNMAFYGYSEVDHWYSNLQHELETNKIPASYPNDFKAKRKPEQLAASIMKKWLERHQDYVRKELNQEAMFCHTYASVGDMEDNISTSFFSLSDVVGLHIYGEHKDINFEKRASTLDEFSKKYQKPVIIEETGVSYVALYCCTGIEFHNNLWSSAMMGGFGTGLDWWWDRGIHDFGYHGDMKKLSQFFETEKLCGRLYEPQRWSDKRKSAAKRRIENYCLVSNDQERALGWVHNATYYWRNLADNSCISNLVSGESAQSPPCRVAPDPYGFDPSDRPYECLPRKWHNMYNPEVENLKDFAKEQFTDYYTSRGGASPLGDEKELVKNPTFVVSGLKASGLSKKKRNWYRVEFYSTKASHTSPEPISEYTQELVSRPSGKLGVNIPPLNDEHPDFSYKISFIGRK